MAIEQLSYWLCLEEDDDEDNHNFFSYLLKPNRDKKKMREHRPNWRRETWEQGKREKKKEKKIGKEPSPTIGQHA